ncbi:MAG: hypothetical protein J6X78_09755 [Treponema sp.]|nr:hypothetical protein [Treponema sp.]
MALYLISIIGGDLIIFILNYFFNPAIALKWLIIGTAIAPVALIAWDGVVATFIRRVLPAKWYDYKVEWRKVSDKECKFYDALNIKAWKDKVLELGVFTSFSKKKIANPRSREYMEQFILECNYGWSIHLWNAILGFLLIPVYPAAFRLPVILPACCINFVLSMLPFMILRYNLPRLHRARNVLEKKEALYASRQQNQAEQTEQSEPEN